MKIIIVSSLRDPGIIKEILLKKFPNLEIYATKYYEDASSWLEDFTENYEEIIFISGSRAKTKEAGIHIEFNDLADHAKKINRHIILVSFSEVKPTTDKCDLHYHKDGNGDPDCKDYAQILYDLKVAKDPNKKSPISIFLKKIKESVVEFYG